MVRIETFPKAVIDAMMKSYQSIAPVRVLMRVVDMKDFPSKLPENVLTQSWLNQIQVLSKLSIFSQPVLLRQTSIISKISKNVFILQDTKTSKLL